MQHPRGEIFTAASLALVLMTVLSAWMGRLLPVLIPRFVHVLVGHGARKDR